MDSTEPDRSSSYDWAAELEYEAADASARYTGTAILLVIIVFTYLSDSIPNE
jgi:hypothetical protein